MTRLFRGRGRNTKGREVGARGEVRGKVEGSGMRESGFEDPISTPTLLVLTDIKP